MNEDKVYRTTMARGFEYFDRHDIEEVGISFNSELSIGNDVSVLTNKDIPLKSAQETKDTYLKVMEMRELTLAEAEMANGVRGFLKRAFHEVYNGSKFWILWGLYLTYYSGVAIYQENFAMALLGVACLAVHIKPIHFYKFVKKILNEPERLEELKKFLQEKNVSGYVYSVEKDEDIKMYVKLRGEN